MKDIDWKRPTLIGSLIVAVPSLVSFFTYPNRFFWFWSLIGGIVAAWLLSRASSRRLTLGDGAKIGFMSGLIGGAIYLVISAPVFAAWRIDQLIEELLKTPNPPANPSASCCAAFPASPAKNSTPTSRSTIKSSKTSRKTLSASA